MWLANHALKAHQPWLGIVSTPIRQRQKKANHEEKTSLSQSKLVHMGKKLCPWSWVQLSAFRLEPYARPMAQFHPIQTPFTVNNIICFYQSFCKFKTLPLYLHLMLKNFSMPMSAPKPLSVTKMRKGKKLHIKIFFCTISSNNDHITGVGTQINISNTM